MCYILFMEQTRQELNWASVPAAQLAHSLGLTKADMFRLLNGQGSSRVGDNCVTLADVREAVRRRDAE
jgi:hypothetical protein